MEFAVLFGVIPLCYAIGWLPLPKIPLLLTVSGVALAYLIKTKNLPKSAVFIQFREIKPYIRPIILRCLAVTAFSVAAVAVLTPSELFAFPRSRPLLWLAVMGLYPILSALPQELLYRAFLFARYPPILRTPAALTLASVLSFAFLHVVFGNPVAVVLTIPAGYVFTRTYRDTGSLTLAALEHAAYGCIVFTVGLGRFFYHPA
ncbi:CPBP family intramembrane glutamic endopeptidase [Pseudodesulfovibrio indicus]|nr:CPBP family intramembrane glutamic endopeptidase [Pseudodesulfovibrio indicus]TDT87231.1 CAAX prenyl protease-like protein [Pseudodesulfovibrio indicus]